MTVLVVAVALAAAGCGGSNSGSSSDLGSSVSGTVTYRERIALTPDARLIVQIRDTTYVDAASVLIAEQVITSPGQVPIDFEVYYDTDDIDPRNTYGVSARIVESDGRLAFINDTAYDVITRGNPTKVDMVLVVVEPPPGAEDWTEVEEPVHVTGTEYGWDGDQAFVHVRFAVSKVEGCYSIGREEASVEGNRIVVDVMAWVPPPSWGIDCSDRSVELDSYVHLGEMGAPFASGETYTVEVNGQRTLTLSVP